MDGLEYQNWLVHQNLQRIRMARLQWVSRQAVHHEPAETPAERWLQGGGPGVRSAPVTWSELLSMEVRGAPVTSTHIRDQQKHSFVTPGCYFYFLADKCPSRVWTWGESGSKSLFSLGSR